MPTVTVPAIRSFTFAGSFVAAGSSLTCTPLEASILAREGKVSLTKGYKTRALTASRTPEPEAPKRRRRYKRVDMTAETE